MRDIVDAFVEYTLPGMDKFKYYTNLTEVCAKNSEAIYWSKLANKKLNAPAKVSDEFLQNYMLISKHNTMMLLKAAGVIS